MQNERRAAQCRDLLQTVKGEVRRALIDAVGVSDADGECLDRDLLQKTPCIVHVDQICLGGHAVLGAADCAELSLDGNADGVRCASHFLRYADIFLQRQAGSIDHHGSEAISQALDYLFIGCAMIQM